MTKTKQKVRVLEVREADAATDIYETAALGAAAFRDSHSPFLEAAVVEAIVSQIYSEERIRGSVRTCRDSSTGYFLVAHRGARLAGFLEYDEQGDEPELRRLYVRPDQKGTGIGSALLHALHERLPIDAPYHVTVFVKNLLALRFYARHGFRETGRTTQHYPGVELPPEAQPSVVVFLDAPAPRTSKPQSHTGRNDPGQEDRK